MTDLQQFEECFLRRQPLVVVQTFEEDYVLGLIRELSIEVQVGLWVWSATEGLREGLLADSPPVPDTANPAGTLFLLSRERRAAGIYVMLDLAGHLKDERTLRCLRDAVRTMAKSASQLILLDQADTLPPVVEAMAVRVVPSLPDEAELHEIVRRTLREENERCRIEVDLGRADLQTVVRNLQGLTRRQAREAIIGSVCVDRRLDTADINRILAEKRRSIGRGGILDYVEAPVDLKEIGGLTRLKTWLARRQNCTTPAAAAFGITAPRGILMLGVQGTGKSLSAKAVATAWQRPLLRLDAGALYDRYIGESERRLREALAQAERMAPVVLWIDEIEKGFASAASLSTDGGLSKRMFGTLLTWMQEHAAPVFLVATANDIEALPPELLRKGRFDEIFFIDLPDLEARTQILSIHLKKRSRDPASFDLPLLAEASHGFSGAEIEQALVSALHEAFAHNQDLTDARILDALKASPPLSVTMAEKIEALQQWARGRCVPAD